MKAVLKKLLVVLPVAVLGFLYLKDHYNSFYSHTSSRRLLFLGFTLFLLYGWIFFEVAIRKQRSVLSVVIQSSFYVYIFMVLTLTGFFILFREISTHDWWQKMMLRIDRKDHVNL